MGRIQSQSETWNVVTEDFDRIRIFRKAADFILEADSHAMLFGNGNQFTKSLDFFVERRAKLGGLNRHGHDSGCFGELATRLKQLIFGRAMRLDSDAVRTNVQAASIETLVDRGGDILRNL